MVHIGQSAQISKTITVEDILAFGHLVGDTNPVHMDDSFAAKTRFGKRIAHGMFGASMISAILGTQLPGPGTIYLSQTLKFFAPVYLGDTVCAEVTVVKVREDKPVITLETVCKNQDGHLLLQGEAVVLFESVTVNS
jgi:3-hydroxybutyryl-CoA dehydratase